MNVRSPLVRPHLLVCLLTALAAMSPVNRVFAQEPAQGMDGVKAPQPPQVGGTAPDFTLEALDGTKVKLSEQTAQGMVVLIELRGYPGYQCPFCTKQVGALLNQADEFKKANARVVLVYPGPSADLKAHAEEFVRGKDIPQNFYFLLDPDYAMTTQYGLRWDAPHETSYPSTFVLDTARKVLFAKISHTHGDRTTPDEILAALPKATPPQ